MKKSISLVLCLAMLVSVFSCLGVTASAAGDAKELFTIKDSGFKKDKITYTIYLNKGVNMSGSIFHIKFDPEVLSVVKSENNNAYMVDDGDGGQRENIGGVYEAGFLQIGGTKEDPVLSDDTFSIGHVYSPDVDYKAGSSDKPYMQITFKAINKNRPSTKVRFFCDEFLSVSDKTNNIKHGSAQLFNLYEGTTLSETEITSVSSEKEGVRISWKKTTGADKYRIYKKNDDGKLVTLQYTENGDVTTYLDTDVKNNREYTYTVRAMNEAGLNSCYDKDGVTTRYTVAPSKVTLSNGDGKVVVSWTKVSGATAYRVYRRNVNSDGTVGQWKSLGDKTTKLKFSDKTAKNGSTYEYAVRVYSKGGNSALYSEKKITYISLPETTIKATTTGVRLSWEKVSGAEGYKIYRKIKGGSWKVIKTLSSSTTAYTDKSIGSGKYAYYAVKAVKGSYVSGYDTLTISYLKTPKVSVKNTSSGVRISWGKVSGAKSYEIYRKAGSAKSWTKITTTKNVAFTDKNVKSGKTYKYCIRAINGSVKSAYGGSTYETIRFLSAPKLGTIKSAKNGVTINWEAVNGASGYVVYRQTASGSYKKLATVKGKTTVKYVDKSAEKGTTYSYRVYATYNSYTSSYKSSLSIKDIY